MYWRAVANCAEPAPWPACELLLNSALYALVLNPQPPWACFALCPSLGYRRFRSALAGRAFDSWALQRVSCSPRLPIADTSASRYAGTSRVS